MGNITRNLLKRIKVSIKNCAWVFLILLSLQSFTYKIPYCIVLGVMLLSISFIFLPWLNKILSSYDIKLKTLDKLFIVISNIVVAAYGINPGEKSYYRCILPIVIFALIWLLVIFYKRKKSK